MKNIIAGLPSSPIKSYQHIALSSLVGKTIEAIAEKRVESANGLEPCIVLLFTDKTSHGFVIANP